LLSHPATPSQTEEITAPAREKNTSPRAKKPSTKGFSTRRVTLLVLPVRSYQVVEVSVRRGGRKPPHQRIFASPHGPSCDASAITPLAMPALSPKDSAKKLSNKGEALLVNRRTLLGEVAKPAG
jgi:hypothetical protein